MKKSFTLIELIVVIAIIAILAAVIAPNAFKAIEKSKVTKAIVDFRAIKAATLALYADAGIWPGVDNRDIDVSASYIMVNDDPTQAGIQLAVGWDGPYLDGDPGPHPWAGTYIFDSQDDYDSDGNREMVLEYENRCFGGGGSTCGVPPKSAEKIDFMVDDGDLSTGDVRQGSGEGDDMGWVLRWNPY